MTFEEVTKVMGDPTEVTDLQGDFYGLSPQDDMFILPNRDRLSKRAVWYLQRSGGLPNLHDVWFTAYFSISSGKLVGKLRNPP